MDTPALAFDDPKTQGMLALAAGILNASGPSRYPVGIGQVLGQGIQSGLGGYQQAKKEQMQNVLMALQMNKLQKDAEAQAAFNRLYSGWPSAAPGGTQQNPSVVLNDAARAALPPAPQTQGPGLNDIGRLMAIDPERGKAALELWKAQNPDVLIDEAGVPRNRRTGQPITGVPVAPKINHQGFATQAVPDGQGGFKIQMTPGGLEAFLAQQRASEQAKAERDLQTVPATGPNVPPTFTTREALVNPGAGKAPVAAGMSPAIAASQAADAAQQQAVSLNFGKVYNDLQNASMSNPAKISKYQKIGSLLDGFEGGKLSQTGLNIASAANSAGIKIDAKLPNKEAAVALTSELALDMRSTANGGGMPGAMSDQDREFLKSMAPNLSQTNQGRKQIIDTKVKLLERENQVAKMARMYREKYKKLDDGFFNQLQDWSNRNPIFGK